MRLSTQFFCASSPPFKPRHDLGKIKIEPRWPLLSLPLAHFHSHLYSPSPSLPSPPLPFHLHSDIVAAVLLQLGNVHAPTQARVWGRGFEDFLLSPVGNVAFINTILTHNKLNIQKHTIKSNNSLNSSAIRQKNVFVGANLWCGVQNRRECQTVWSSSNYGSPQYLDRAKQQNNSGVNAPTLGLLTASEDPVAPDNLWKGSERGISGPRWYHHEHKSSLFSQPHARQRRKWKIHVRMRTERGNAREANRWQTAGRVTLNSLRVLKILTPKKQQIVAEGEQASVCCRLGPEQTC